MHAETVIHPDGWFFSLLFYHEELFVGKARGRKKNNRVGIIDYIFFDMKKKKKTERTKKDGINVKWGWEVSRLQEEHKCLEP